MERRAKLRMRYRLPTEIVHGGTRHHGFLIDVSSQGAFIQTTRGYPTGAELELWFADDQLAPQVARARVVRRRGVHASAAAVARSGIGIEWLVAPRFARELDAFGGIDVEIDGVDELAIESVHGAAGDAQAEQRESEASPGELALAYDGGRASLASDAAAADAALAATDAARATAAEEPRTDAERPAGAAPASPDANAGDIVPLDLPPLVEQSLELGPQAVRAEVALIDEGELGEIEALIRALGASTLRMRWGAQADPVVWEAPPKLIVVSARIALTVPLSDTVLGSGALGIAVCDSEASTLRAQLRRQGYELVIQRSAHPATLRLLFASRLERPRERRRRRRSAFGGAVTFWRGLRRTRGTLLELSMDGARLLLGQELARGAKLTLRVAAKHAGGRGLALPVEVVRSASAAEGVELGVRIGALSARKRKRLGELIARLDANGPVSAPAARGAPGSGERRRAPRVRFAQQALVLDARTRVARDVLFGTDLSLGGMRVEPHPRLARGASLQIALQPPGGGDPIFVRAEVARDDGERGLVLRFRRPSASAQRAIERLLDAAAEVERTRAARSAPDERVVLGRLVEAPAS